MKCKCSQLSKPEVTVERNQNFISTMEKKALGETKLSQGISPPLAIFFFFFLFI